MSEQREPTRGAILALQAFTLARIPLAIGLAAVLLAAGPTPAALLVALGFLALVELTDLFDGIIARRYGIVTEWGAMLDPYADSISRLIVFWSLASAGLVLPVVPLVMALRDVTVAYCRITLARNGKTVSAKFSGKLKAVVQAVGGFLALVGPFHFEKTGAWTVHVLSWAVIAVTLFSVLEYVRAAFRAALSSPVPRN